MRGLFSRDTKLQKHFSGSVLQGDTLYGSIVLSDCVQQDKAKTGGVTAPTVSDQGADRAD